MTETERAYREGKIDAKLEQHDAHFRVINGSIERTANELSNLNRTVDSIAGDVRSLQEKMPRILTVAEEAEKARIADETLKKKNEETKTTWERYRSLVMWTGGCVAFGTTTANFWLGLFGIG